MANFVLVHGGGHGGWCWKPLAQQLRAAGHEVHAPTLTGLGERSHLLSPQIGLDTHIEDVVQLLHFEDVRDAILVGHSYGGMVITGAADRALDRVGRLVYLDAAIPRDGETLLDCSPGLKAWRDVRVVDGVELGLWPDTAAASLYGLTDPEVAAWAIPRLTPHPWSCFEEKLRLDHPEAVEALARAIVNCPSTLHRRPAEKLERWFAADYVREINTGHDLMLTDPDAVCHMLLEIAG